MTNDKGWRRPVQYMTGRTYLVGRRALKLWAVQRKCKWRDRACWKHCRGQLKFAGVKQLYCGYLCDMTPLFKRVSVQNARIKAHGSITAHISKGALSEGYQPSRGRK